MKIYITGATGFVGSYVVDEALRRGHEVCAVVRPSSNSTLGDVEGVSLARVDLRSMRDLADSLAGVDLVIHLAAAKSGDFYTQFAGTVVATENLLAAMNEAGVKHLVVVSTFSVYDFLNTKPGTLIDEDALIDQAPALRDEYAQTKLIQEDLYHQFGEQDDNNLVILRPGMIYGAGNLWHALLGAEFGPKFLKIGSKAILPMAYVENCAEAMVQAAEKLTEDPSPIDGQVINIVDDNLPTQERYAELVSAKMDTPSSIALPWPVVKTAAGMLNKGNEVVLNGRAKFPGIAVSARLHARFKPLRYTNQRAKALLGWSPRHDLASAINRSIAAQQAEQSNDDQQSGADA